jgi:hypothetical protein
MSYALRLDKRLETKRRFFQRRKRSKCNQSLDSKARERNYDLKRQYLAAFSNSKLKTEEAIAEANELKTSTDKIWEAYSQAELGIGLVKLAFQDKLGIKIGWFRKLDPGEILGKKSDSANQQRLKLNLSASNRHLETAMSNLAQGKAAEGLEQARKARDILKSILLWNSSGADKRKNPRKRP